METTYYVKLLIAYTKSLGTFEIEESGYVPYNHIGATLADAILQAGVNYRTVVHPRINRILEVYPNVKTSIEFLSLIERDGANKILNWNHSEKPRRLYELTQFLVINAVYTEAALSKWLTMPENNSNIQKCINGIGPKTVDYLKNLVGVPAIAVDRHLKKFINDAGIPYNDYYEVQNIIEETAKEIGTSYMSLDKAIWNFQSTYGTNYTQ